MRELEQAVRRIVLTGRYAADFPPAIADDSAGLIDRLRAGELTASELLAGYCTLLYRWLGTYDGVAKPADLDPRTTRKFIEASSSSTPRS